MSDTWTWKYQCEQFGCSEEAVGCCENCDHWFCWEHGQKGGDRQVQDVGAVAYPSICEMCINKK